MVTQSQRRKKLQKVEIKRRLMSVEETAHYLGISPQTIYNKTHRRAKNRFPVKPKRVGKLLKFDKREVDAYVDSL